MFFAIEDFFLDVKFSERENPARGSKSPSRGGGVDLNFRGGHKKSKQVGFLVVLASWRPGVLVLVPSSVPVS